MNIFERNLTNISHFSPYHFRYLDDNFFILNYKFVKEFSEGNNDDWIISYINHASIRDEMNEQTKGFQEMMQKMREQNQKK